MNSRRALNATGTILVAVLLVALIAGQVLGQPVLLAYVTSESMEPTIMEGDGYVVVPAFLTDEPEVGDIVVFHARVLHDGGLTTHRVVDRTDAGYITKGDNNPFTDQDGGEPPVTGGQVAAEVLQIGGEPVTIPALGTAVEGFQALLVAPIDLLGERNAGPGLVGLGILLFVLAGEFGGHHRDTDRSRERRNVVAMRTVVLVAVLIVTGAATAAMAMPAGVFEFGLVVTDTPSDEPQQVSPGGQTAWTYDTHNGGLLPMLVVTDPASEAVSVEPERVVLMPGDRVEMTVSSQAPAEQGTYLRSVRESRYLLVVPPLILMALHALHPLLALLAVNVVVASFVVAVSVSIFGTGYLRFRSRPTQIPVRIRVRRRLRRFR